MQGARFVLTPKRKLHAWHVSALGVRCESVRVGVTCAVSYTHLDVYKRQVSALAGECEYVRVGVTSVCVREWVLELMQGARFVLTRTSKLHAWHVSVLAVRCESVGVGVTCVYVRECVLESMQGARFVLTLSLIHI